MKFALLFTALLFSLSCLSQKLPSGTYTFRYCDMEYNQCIGHCKVVIKGNRIAIYAGKDLNLSGVSEGGILNKGIITRNASGVWYVLSKKIKSPDEDEGKDDENTKIDFKKRQYWQF